MKHEKLKAENCLTELNKPLFIDDLVEASGMSRETIKASLVD
jgi:DNA-binding transcriptional regulator GbsR (MarR family)